MMITIKREGDDWAEGIDRSEALVKVCSFSAQEIIAKIKDAGIVGMGGATFPTHVKLSVPPGKKAECVIINGVECEPYLTSDHRTMLEHGEELVVGVTILMKAVGVGESLYRHREQQTRRHRASDEDRRTDTRASRWCP